MLDHMRPTSAGIKRNRMPQGVVAARPDVVLRPETQEAYVAAARASGNLSVSLYLERLRALLEAQNGTLPVVDDRVELPIPAA